MKLQKSTSIAASRPSCGLALLVALCLFSAGARPAQAVPAFGIQTGKHCQACHVGGFGPQLTPYGREFKLTGYTDRTNSFNAPFSAMAVMSYVQTQKDQVNPPAAGYRTNDNLALDQVSLFFAGGFGEHLGAFVQTTYNGTAKAWNWDNLDIRATTKTTIARLPTVVGLSVNNSPSVQDAWNTLPAWGYRYTTSSLAPSPSASPLISGALAQTTLGATAYAWINTQYYLEAGAYGSPGATTLVRLGVDPTSPGSIQGLAPYVRLAYKKAFKIGVFEMGAFGMDTAINPGLDRSTGLTDRYTDIGLDGSYLKTFQGGNVLSINARYLSERQSLDATCALDAAGPDCARNSLREIRADASYYWRNEIGGTVGVFNTTGSANPTLYADNRVSKPDSTGMLFQLDGTPFGSSYSPLGARFNIRAGVQYTLYTQFDGAGVNFDGAGRNARDNNTARVFLWVAY